MNLLQETITILELNGKTLEDILWYGTTDCVYNNPLPEFFNIDYDSGFGSQEIPQELVVVGVDWWLERHEYDGSEWWEFKEYPTMPTENWLSAWA